MSEKINSCGEKRVVVAGFMVLLAMVPVVVSGPKDPGVPSEHNISAVVSDIWTSFPRAGGPGDILLRAPFDMCVDSKGRLFILDMGERLEPVRILVLNRKMQVEQVIGSTEDVTIRIPQFGYYLSDIAVDSKGRLYVCDATYRLEYPGGPPLPGRVHVLHSNLSWLGYIEIPMASGGVGYPYCIAIDQKDRLIVGQSEGGGESRILIFAPNQTSVNDVTMVLERVVQICRPGEDCAHRHGTPEDITVDPQGRVVVSESISYETQYFPELERVVLLDQDFRWLMGLGSYGKEPGHFTGLASAVVDPSGVIIAADLGTKTISFFFPNGTFAGRMGREGSEPGEFSSLGRMMVTERGNIMLADLGKKAIQRIVVDLSSLRPVAVVQEKAALLGLFLITIALATRLLFTLKKATTSLQYRTFLTTLPFSSTSTRDGHVQLPSYGSSCLTRTPPVWIPPHRLGPLWRFRTEAEMYYGYYKVFVESAVRGGCLSHRPGQARTTSYSDSTGIHTVL